MSENAEKVHTTWENLRQSTTPTFDVKNGDKFFLVRIYRQYTIEEGHRSVRKLWSLYYRFIGLRCHNCA